MRGGKRVGTRRDVDDGVRGTISPVDRGRERGRRVGVHERAAQDHRVIGSCRVGRLRGEREGGGGLIEIDGLGPGRACDQGPVIEPNRGAERIARSGRGFLHGADCPAEGRTGRIGVEEIGGAGVARPQVGSGGTDQCRVLRSGYRGAEIAATAIGLDERREQRRGPSGCGRGIKERRTGTRIVVRRPDEDVGADSRHRRAEAECRRCVGVGDRGDRIAGRAVEQEDSADRPGEVDRRGPDDHVVAVRRDRGAEIRAGLRRWIRDVEEQIAEIRLGGVALELVDLARAAIHPGRAHQNICVGLADGGAEMGLVQAAGVRDGQGRQKVAESRALVIGVEDVDHAVAGPGQGAAGRPDNQVVADHCERGAELITGLGMRVVEDVNQGAVCIGCDGLVGGGDTVVEVDRACAVVGRRADRDIAVDRCDGCAEPVAGRGRCECLRWRVRVGGEDRRHILHRDRAGRRVDPAEAVGDS